MYAIHPLACWLIIELTFLSRRSCLWGLQPRVWNRNDKLVMNLPPNLNRDLPVRCASWTPYHWTGDSRSV